MATARNVMNPGFPNICAQALPRTDWPKATQRE